MSDDLKLTPEADAELGDLFALARADSPVPSVQILSRIAQDAAQIQAGFGAQNTAAPLARSPWWRQLFDDIGGLPALGGLAACACAGVYLGFINPDVPTGWTSAAVEDSFETDGVMSHAMLGDVYWIEEG